MLRMLVLFAGILTLTAGIAGGYYFWNLSRAESIAPQEKAAASFAPRQRAMPEAAVDSSLASEARQPAPAPATHDSADLGIARVSYFFMHRSPENGDTLHERTTTGAILRDAEGALAVLVARSAVDARWAANDLANVGEVLDEELSVEFVDGTAATASVIWNAPGEADLALLRVAPGEVETEISAAPIRFDGNAGGRSLRVEARWIAGKHGIKRVAAIWGADGSVAGLDERVVSAVLFVDGAAAGILPAGRGAGNGSIGGSGRFLGGPAARAVSFETVPDSFRGGAK